VHLEEYALQHYSAIAAIGPLFLLDCVAATLLAAALAIRATPLLRAAAIGLAAGSLAALALSETTGLLGFREAGLRPAIALALAFEAGAVVLLAPRPRLLASRRRLRRAAPG